MKKFKKLLPAILMIVFELAVGILLLLDGEKFTNIVFIIFGAVLMLSAIAMVIRYLAGRQEAAADPAGKAAPSIFNIIFAVILFIFGAVFAFGYSLLYGLIQLVLIFYGALMIVGGIFKVIDYIALRKDEFGVSLLNVIIGILSVGVGILVLFNPFGALYVVYTIMGIYLIVEAVLDVIALIIAVKATKALKAEITEKYESQEYAVDDLPEKAAEVEAVANAQQDAISPEDEKGEGFYDVEDFES